jgi:hypothetical protein
VCVCDTMLGEGKLGSRIYIYIHTYIGAHHKAAPMCKIHSSYYLKIGPEEQLALCEAVECINCI